MQRNDARLTAGASIFFLVTFFIMIITGFSAFFKKEKKQRSVNDSIVKPNGEKDSHCFFFVSIQNFIVVHLYDYLKVEEI